MLTTDFMKIVTTAKRAAEVYTELYNVPGNRNVSYRPDKTENNDIFQKF